MAEQIGLEEAIGLGNFAVDVETVGHWIGVRGEPAGMETKAAP